MQRLFLLLGGLNTALLPMGKYSLTKRALGPGELNERLAPLLPDLGERLLVIWDATTRFVPCDDPRSLSTSNVLVHGGVELSVEERLAHLAAKFQLRIDPQYFLAPPLASPVGEIDRRGFAQAQAVLAGQGILTDIPKPGDEVLFGEWRVRVNRASPLLVEPAFHGDRGLVSVAEVFHPSNSDGKTDGLTKAEATLRTPQPMSAPPIVIDCAFFSLKIGFAGSSGC